MFIVPPPKNGIQWYVVETLTVTGSPVVFAGVP
jgi:hypothetical protein